MVNKDIGEYFCSIHGNHGNPDCQECMDNLKRLCGDNDAILFDEEGGLV